MTPYMQGFSKVEFHKESVTMANGLDEGSSFSGNIVGMKVDNQGNEDFPIELNNVSYIPGSTFNLFSTSVLTQKGWLLFGNNKSMWLEKEGTKLVFDIKVSTDKGVLYCMKIDRKDKRYEMANLIMKHRKKESAEIEKIKEYMNNKYGVESYVAKAKEYEQLLKKPVVENSSKERDHEVNAERRRNKFVS